MENDAHKGQPDIFDRLLGALHGLPGVTCTNASTVRAVTPLTGDSQLFIVQTYRQREAPVDPSKKEIIKSADTIFLECTRQGQYLRVAIPPAVADVIARQRDSLASKTRRKAAKANAQARKDRGELPGFMRGRKKKNS